MTQGICGRTYFDCGEPIGPLAEWESRLRKRLATVGSTECALVWREKVTPAGQSIFRLSRSTVLTNGTGYIGSPWPTVKASAGGADPEERKTGLSLQTYMTSPWNTVSARDWKDTAGMATDRPDGGSRIDQLPRQMIAAEKAVWPTVTSLSFKDSHQPGNCSSMNKMRELITGETAASGQNTTGSFATTAKRVGSPTPAHPCWLQGFGAEWLYLAPQNSARPRTRKKRAG